MPLPLGYGPSASDSRPRVSTAHGPTSPAVSLRPVDPSPVGTRGTRAGRLVATLSVALVMAVAAAVRIRYFALGRGFWRDELSLVQNLDVRGFGGLTRQLGDATTAPPLFLWAVKAGMVAGLTSEPAMRILPFLAGLAVLPVTAMLARRTGMAWGWTAVPVAALAFVPQIVFYTAQLKPYTLDMLGVTGALVLAHGLARNGVLDPANRRARWAYLVLAIISPWLSLGCMLTLGPITAWLLVVSWRSRPIPLRGSWRWLTGLAVAAVSTLGAALLAEARNSAVTRFGDSFADWLSPLSRGQGSLGANGRWFGFLVHDFLRQDLAGPHPFVLGLLLVAGWCCVLRRSRATAFLLVLPAATALVAAVAGEYPFGRRLVLFVVPALVAGLAPLAADVAAVVRLTVSRLIPGRAQVSRIVAFGVSALVLGSTATLTFATPAILSNGLRYQYGIDDYRPSLQTVAAGYRPGDVIVVGVDDRVAARVYGPRLGIPAAAFVMADAAGPGTEPNPAQRADTSCAVPGRLVSAARIWLVESDRLTIAQLPAQEVLRGRLLRTHEVVSAADTRHVWAALLVRRAAPVATVDTAAARVCVVYRPIGPVGAAIGDQPLLS